MPEVPSRAFAQGYQRRPRANPADSLVAGWYEKANGNFAEMPLGKIFVTQMQDIFSLKVGFVFFDPF